METAISPANASQLSQQWTANLAGPGSDPVVADGHVFVTANASANSQLTAFDASGITNCTGTAPKSCSPQWSALPGGQFLSAPAVNGGAVWTGNGGAPVSGGATMTEFNETTGAPMMSSGLGYGTPAVAGNTMYVNWDYIGQFQFAGLEAVDAATGVVTLGFGPPPPFASGGPDTLFDSPAVSNGILYAASPTTLYAFDATGTTNCGTPLLRSDLIGFSTYCSPLWTATLSGTVNSKTFTAVNDGYVYVGDSTGTLSVFPAGGCGAPTCSPVWTGKTNGAIESSPAVTPTTVYIGSDDGTISAFPANGCGAATCQPLWQARTGGAVKSSPSVGGDVVYVGSDDDNLYAFNASGCGAATCTPLLQTNVGAPVETSPAVANGQVFVTDTAGTLHAYGLAAAPGS